MTKSILVMALAATLILSTFSLGSAFAVNEGARNWHGETNQRNILKWFVILAIKNNDS